MDVARKVFNSQHCTTYLIDLFGKRYNIDERDQTFRWLCLNEVDNYLTLKRICELGKHCSYKSEKGYDIKVDIKENENLVCDIRNWLLTRKLERSYYMCGSIENICSFRIYKLFMNYYKYNVDKANVRFQKIIENSKSTYQFYKHSCWYHDTIVVGSKDCFVIEINEEEHSTLIKDITNKLTMQIKKQIRGKKGHIGIKVFKYMENPTKKIKLEVDPLLKITFDYITKRCKMKLDEETNELLVKWNEASVFCLALKIKKKLFTDYIYWSMCSCEPFKCKRYCCKVNHEKIPYQVNKECDYCITFDCDGCTFRDNISKISGELLQNPDDIGQIYYSINKLFVLLHSYVGFVGKKNYFDFLLPIEGNCCCNWDCNYI